MAGKAGQGEDWQGRAGHGVVRHGRQGQERHGRARLGMAGYGRQGNKIGTRMQKEQLA